MFFLELLRVLFCHLCHGTRSTYLPANKLLWRADLFFGWKSFVLVQFLVRPALSVELHWLSVHQGWQQKGQKKSTTWQPSSLNSSRTASFWGACLQACCRGFAHFHTEQMINLTLQSPDFSRLFVCNAPVPRITCLNLKSLNRSKQFLKGISFYHLMPVLLEIKSISLLLGFSTMHSLREWFVFLSCLEGTVHISMYFIYRSPLAKCVSHFVYQWLWK